MMSHGKRRATVEQWLSRLERWAGSRLLPVSGEIMREWGSLCARHERTGRRLPVLDSLIAATAIKHQLLLEHLPEEISR
jgi:predicted nucleic acid-binding protein